MQLSQFIPCKTPFDPCEAYELLRCKAAPAILQNKGYQTFSSSGSPIDE